MAKEMAPWDRSALYQVYPLSFNEHEEREPQRGNGSIRGITEKLPYLIELGVDAIWISPPYPSPMKDAGYDISHFTDIHPDLGTLEDFDELVAKCHENGIRVMMDFIPNHSSDQHEWFQKSRHREAGYEDFYIWNAGKKDENGNLIYGEDGRPLVPNNWGSVFSKPNRKARDRGEMPHLRDDEWTPPISAWQWDEERGEYYLHLFAKEQPDLNWKNDRVAQVMLDNMRFWIERGVDGFRMDAFNHAAKNHDFPDEPINEAYNEQDYDNPFDQLRLENSSNYMPEYHRILKLFCGVAREYRAQGRDIRFVIESYVGEAMLREINAIDPEIATTFNFGSFRMPWNATLRKMQMDYYYQTIGDKNIPNQVNGNHDNPRLATRYGDEAARSMAVTMLFSRGMRVIYNGEELGLHDGDVPEHRMQDPNGLRDGARTPMIWDHTKPNSGFSYAESSRLWLPVNEKDFALAASRQEQDNRSSLALYRAAIRLCRELPAVRDGEQISLDNSNPKHVFAYERNNGHDRTVVVTNCTPEYQQAEVGASVIGRAVLSSIDVEQLTEEQKSIASNVVSLRPHEAIVIVPER